eukprot:CAMPEP_0114490602 /NCGR_PEP_ID=MMETSP0109-20121206/2533_1 /TAXON_ID=29199 /ORGANISM="Chlorarachnion reptans, Strain CCCM449" /LENGTH=407 /DNA_ID=CAMNT_0001667237 /DNA_START=435 /DNA_END=1658 /DNA_ORIENTATION=+
MTMHTLFKEHPNGLAVEEFFPVTTTFCALSSYCNSLIFSQIDSKGTGRVSQRMFWDYYTKNMQKFDPPTRLFKLLKSETGPGGQQYLTRESFTPLVEEVVRRHPGLEFLKSHPEFQARYSQTVKARIFYKVNRAANEQLTLGEFKRSNFCQVLGLLDEEDDINKIHDYFSYEHFYVIYCKFWELDEDHDFEIDNKDLMRYDDFALTTKVIDRVMEGCGRPFVSRTPGRMGYEDFVVFLMSEVDKTSDISLEYWFRCLDLDGDGVIAAYELEYFFSEQAQRLQQLSQEEVLYTDVLCQLNDMVKPKRESCFTKKDLRNTKMATQFFNIIFNLSRHVIAEQRDPILIHQVHSTPELCDWDRYAINEYIKLAESEINESEAFDQANEELDWDAKEIDVNEDMDDGNPLLD